MSCNFERLPLEVPTHSFFYFIKSVLNNKNYQNCIMGSTSLGCKGPFSKNICHARKFPAYPDTAPKSGLSLSECHDLLKEMKGDQDIQPFFEKYFSRQRKGTKAEQAYKDFASTVEEYQSCMSKISAKTSPCLPIMQDECSSTSIRAIKAIRLRMETAREAMDDDDDIILLLMFRDPRGIIASRFKSGFVSANSARDKVREAQMLCKKMTDDYNVYSDMLVDDNYDGRIVMLRYESVAKDPVMVARRVYWNMMRMAVPDDVMKYVNGSTAGEHDDGMMGTIRKNGTFTANKWKTELTQIEIRTITDVCGMILKRLRYPLDV